jgi:hypothetical protein
MPINRCDQRLPLFPAGDASLIAHSALHNSAILLFLTSQPASIHWTTGTLFSKVSRLSLVVEPTIA